VNSQPRSVTPPSAVNSTSSLCTIINPSHPWVKETRVDHVADPLAQLHGEPQHDVQWPVVDSHIDDVAVRVLDQHLQSPSELLNMAR
jgi:hypothetical protein